MLCFVVCLAGITFVGGCGYDYVNSLKPRTHVVRSSETLYAISRKYKVPLRTIIEQNNLTPPYTLMKGQTLQIPRAPMHVVKKGDTLYSISKKYEVDFNTLAKKNKLKKPWTLQIGQTLYLPANFKAPKTTTKQPQKSKPVKTAQSQKQQPVIKNKPTKVATTPKVIVAPPAVPDRSGQFIYPVKGTIVSKFGILKDGRRNDGINIQAPHGTPFKSVENGVIAYAGNELKGFGNLILVKHSDGWISAYAHARDISVKKGAPVKKGDILGHVGSTGNVKLPQLHFELRKGTKAVDPMNYLKK